MEALEVVVEALLVVAAITDLVAAAHSEVVVHLEVVAVTVETTLLLGIMGPTV